MIRRNVTLLLAAAVLASVPAGAATMTWYTNLTQDQESTPTGSPATGTGTVAFDDVTNVLTLNLAWSGLTGDGMQAHIHCCTMPGTNAGVVLDLWLMNDPRPPSGTYMATYDLDTDNPFRAPFVAANGGTALSAFGVLASAMDTNMAYYNIHTMMHPGGEIRGNLDPVPEPGTVALLLSGLAALVVRRRLTRA